MTDFSKPETRALYEAEVRKRMETPFFMDRTQAETLVAVLMTDPPKKEERDRG
jgi:hypothetical protein